MIITFCFISASVHYYVDALLIQSDTSIANRAHISLINDPSVAYFGNITATTSDYFRLLDLDGQHLLIGARDAVYNISLETFQEAQSIRWPSKQSAQNECQRKGKTKDACHNFVRVLAKHGETGILICGTNAFQPLCRQYDREKYGEYRQVAEFSAIGIAPYDPNHNSTFLKDADLLYTGTVSDFSGADPLIHRRNISKLTELGIRTERNNIKFLNEPQFVGSFKDDRYVYIWFREQASELESCNRGIYSRVARLCRSDMGGPRPYLNEWTSFVKARLNCSIPGDFPFYFDQIESIAKPIWGRYSAKETNTRLVYAVFRSHLSGVSASAICAFDMQHVAKIFAHSTYRTGQSNSAHATWTGAEQNKHRPGTCMKNSRSLSEETIAFVRSNPLVDETIRNYFIAPLSILSGLDQFTQIAIDPQVKALDGRHYDILFVGTDQGNVLKLVNLAGAGVKTSHLSYHIYTLKVTNEPIRNMMLTAEQSTSVSDVSSAELKYLIVISDKFIYRIPIAKCSTLTTCNQCIALRDPHCVWDIEMNRCIFYDLKNNRHLEQDIVQGQSHQRCNQHSLSSHETSLSDIAIVEQAQLSNLVRNNNNNNNYNYNSNNNNNNNSNSCSCTDRTVEICSSNNDQFIVNKFRIATLGLSLMTLSIGFMTGFACAKIKELKTNTTTSTNHTITANNINNNNLNSNNNNNGSLIRRYALRVCCNIGNSNSSNSNSSNSNSTAISSTSPLARPTSLLPAAETALINAYEPVCSKLLPPTSSSTSRPHSTISLEVEGIATPQISIAFATSTLPKNYRLKHYV